jgi:hypothetical protein
MRNLKGRRAISIVIAAVAALVFTGAGVAVGAATTKSGLSVTRTVISTETGATSYSSPNWTTVRTISIYSPAKRFIVARFTAESICSGTAGWCAARILIDNVEAEPKVGNDFAFNSPQGGSYWQSLTMERTRTVTFTGRHKVALQLASVGNANHEIDDWTLTAQVIAV